MSIGDPMVAEKLEQVPGILEEHNFDAWLLFARESHTVHDPCLDLMVGTNVTWPSAFILTARGERLAVVGSLDKANLQMHGHYPRSSATARASPRRCARCCPVSTRLESRSTTRSTVPWPTGRPTGSS